MMASMNTGRYKLISVAVMLLFLTVPAHGWVKGQSGGHEATGSVGLILARDDGKKYYSGKEEYQPKKYRNQKNNAYRKEKAERKEYRRKKYMSLKESVSRVKKRTNGRVLSARPYEEDGHSYHRIKVLTPGGVVRIILIDPEIDDVD